VIVAGLLVALVVVNVLYVLHLERKDRRHDAQVDRLLQRIQAPEIAVATAAQQIPTADPPAVHPDLDEDYWEAQEEALKRISQIEAGER
jgi:ABC-type transport system involved in cytochrome bd biosynthesis fused ATPase/permease subunit